MPRETATSNLGTIAYRNQLIANTDGLDVVAPGVQLRLSNVPLFRQTSSGLAQAIRVRVQPSADPVDLTISIGLNGTWLTETTLQTDVAGSEFLLVPEVEEETIHSIKVRQGANIVYTGQFRVCPQRKWTVHLVHHSHYDIGYTDPQVLVLQSQLAYIDDALELVTATDDWPADAQFRWSIEVAWPLKHWLRTRSLAARDELVRRVQEGRIEINALPFSMHTEAFSFDELARQLEFAQDLRVTLGIEITTAMQTDVPGAAIGLSTLLTDAGIKHLAVAHNYAGRSIPHLLDGQELSRPFRWQAPGGSKVLVWYTDTLHGSAYMEAMTVGFGDGYADVALSLPEYLNAVAQRNYPYGNNENWMFGSLQGVESRRAGYPHDILHLRVQGAYADNAPPSILPATIIREWNEEWAYPKLISSTNRAFFEEAELRLGDQLETFSGDWTDWWADGIGSSAAVLARNRKSQSDIRTAQTLNALADAVGSRPNSDISEDVRAAYEEMALFDEHTWGAADPWGKDAERTGSGEHQWIRKSGFAYSAEERVNLLLNGGIERAGLLARSAHTPDAGESIAVVNPNSWPRTDLVRVFVPRHAWTGESAQLIEVDSGRSIPFVIEPQVHNRYRPLGVWVRFVATDVPPIGYIRYAIVLENSPGTENPAVLLSAPFGNDHFEISLDLEQGSIATIFDRRGNRELVDAAAPFGFNASIHDRYTSGTGFNHLSSRMGDAQPWLLGARGTGEFGLITSRENNPVYQRLTYRQTAQGSDWIETKLTLPHDVPRIHIENRLFKPSVMEKESVYFAFPFAGDDPSVTFEITGGTAGPDSPHVPGSARHFRAIRHWATIETTGADPVAWATSQAPLVQTGNIHLPYAPFPTTIPAHQASNGTIYSWALNNIWDTNFPPQQGGELSFDYVIATGGKEPASELGRDTGASTSQPLVGVRARPGSTGHDAPDRGSFVSVEDPRIEVTHLSTAGNGDLVLHLESHAAERVETNVHVAGVRVRMAETGNFLGVGIENLPIRNGVAAVSIDAGSLRIVRLRIERTE